MGNAREHGGLLARLQKTPVAYLFLIIALAWLPGFFTLPPLDRDESRFAQASKQMLETGDFVSIRFGDEARDQKPVGIYWMQSASAALFGELTGDAERGQIWTYRIPSLLGGAAALALTYWMVRWFAPAETAFLAALLLGATILVWAETKIAKTDAVLLATVLGSQSLLLRSFLSRHANARLAKPEFSHVLLGWGSFGFGILVKGPIVILICLATALGVSLWERNFSWLRAVRVLPGIAIAAAIVLPWAIAIGIETNGAFYANSLGRDFALKLAGVQETHGGPPGYYLLLSPLSFWPASLVLLPGLYYAVRHVREPAIRFLLVWLATTWLMFEFAPTKLPHYVLPAFPTLAIFGALWLSSDEAAPMRRWERAAVITSVVLFAIVGFALIAFALYAPMEFGGHTPPWAYAVAGLAGIAVVTAVVFAASKGRRLESVASAVLAGMLCYALVGFGAVPNLTELNISPRIGAAVAKERLPNDPPVVLAGYSEPSARFLLGTATQFATGARAGALLPETGGLAVVERAEQGAFQAAMAQRGMHAEPRVTIDGRNYSNGRAVSLTLYRVTP